jgi:hypothetical protein
LLDRVTGVGHRLLVVGTGVGGPGEYSAHRAGFAERIWVVAARQAEGRQYAPDRWTGGCHHRQCFFFEDGIHGVTFGTYFVVVLYASILLGHRPAIFTAGLGILAGAALVSLERQGLLSTSGLPMAPTMKWAIYSVTLVLAAYSAYFSSHSLQQAVDQAERDLQERKQLSVMETSLDAIALLDQQGAASTSTPPLPASTGSRTRLASLTTRGVNPCRRRWIRARWSGSLIRSLAPKPMAGA